MADDLSNPDPSLSNLLDPNCPVEWIFVGGKGGVGKTTCSSSLAVQLAAVRESVLLISTDPAHNLSDAFQQKFGPKPTQVKGVDNLFAMEIEPSLDSEFGEIADDSPWKDLIKDVGSSMPGVDEFMSFFELIRQVEEMRFSCIVFDTAPTGHTLRLLSFPDLWDRSIGKLMKISGIGSMMSQLTSLIMNDDGASSSRAEGKFSNLRRVVEMVRQRFKDPEKTTFVCVCIPEFLSIYETERLIQDLMKHEIDCQNVIVNQVLFPNSESNCSLCQSRSKIQKKYMAQIHDLYDDFHVVTMPLLDHEVRSVPSLREFGHFLKEPYVPK